jgi:hypothetical protein
MYGELGPEDIAYLEAFFRSLSAEQLAWLGSLEGAYASVLTPTAEQTIKDNIGRGMTALLDPARGGIDPVTERDRVPAGIRHYVYDYRDVLKDGDAEAFLRDLDGFARLIDGRPGDWFAHDLARAALDHQLLADGLAAVGALDRPHTGSGDLLFAASGNDTIAAHLLNDRSFRETLLTLDWGGKTEADNGWLEPIGQPGPMAFIRNGTRLPYDVDPESPLGQSHLDAAYAVLDYADRNRDAVSARHGDYDESFVKLAVGELAWDYTIPSGPERFDRFGELSSWKDIPPYEGAYEE